MKFEPSNTLYTFVRSVITASLVATSFLSISTAYAVAEKKDSTSGSKPNIVIILSDDFGYGSAGCYGANPALVKTPNIDRLATEGRRFTDANTPASVCSPRATGC